MQLFIVRHGEAEFETKPDNARQLNLNGLAECEKSGNWIADQCPKFDLALVSPYKRAMQTWQAIQGQGIQANRCELLTELTPDTDPSLAASVIKAYSDGLDSVIVVSHLPLVCFLVDELVVESCPLFATGSAALIELKDDKIKSHLVSIVSPAELPNLDNSEQHLTI